MHHSCLRRETSELVGIVEEATAYHPCLACRQKIQMKHAMVAEMVEVVGQRRKEIG